MTKRQAKKIVERQGHIMRGHDITKAWALWGNRTNKYQHNNPTTTLRAYRKMGRLEDKYGR